MYAQTGHNTSVLLPAAALLIIALLIPSTASAAPIVDGRFDPTEGYTTSWGLDFTVEGVPTIGSGGKLWLYEDVTSGDVTLLLSQPLTLVDNTYGENSIGWGKNVAPSGKNHNLRISWEATRPNSYSPTLPAILSWM